MSSAHELLETLATLGANVRAEGQNLKIDAPRGVISPALLAEIRALKSDLLSLLAANESTGPDARPLSFWEQAAAAEPAHRLYLNHIMTCRACHMPTHKFCPAAIELRRQYEEHLQ
jgi:hypothetical protein